MNLVVVNSEEIAKKISHEYKTKLTSEGMTVSEPQKGNYCFEISVTAGRDKVKVLTYYSGKGNKVLLQGNKETKLYSDVHRILFGESLFTENNEFSEPDAYIGTDESGKGDFFGPLVTAGVYLDKPASDELKKAGVKDSKLLSDTAIRKIGPLIRNITGNRFNIVIINPPKYNELYIKFGNLNKLLGWAHARVLENILAVKDAGIAISDKFGDERFILASLQEKGKQLQLLQFARAEKYTAVAAASILARERMLDWFDAASSKYGMDIPKGASPAVEAAAKNIKEKFGPETLNEMIKQHFKTNNRI